MLGAIQRRQGPTKIGYDGILQSFIDGFKLILKESILPHKSNKIIFFFSAFLIFSLSLVNWILIPVNLIWGVVDFEFVIFLSFIFSMLNAYCIILAGWSSNSKYALLGAIRSASQIISYEVYLGLLLIPIFFFSESINYTAVVLHQKVDSFIFLLPPTVMIFFITILAETNITPFYLPEAEAEIVACYNVEYSGIVFSLFFLAEYNNIFLSCSYLSLFFFGDFSDCLFSEIYFFFKLLILVFLFILVRAVLPRYRYDQLMTIG
jgi:NADH-quinone oxidoreductase subunit H